MDKKWDVINILRHYRHDLLNHFQLINGYLAMGRTEKVQSLIDELVRQAKNESQLCNLNMSNFAEEMLTFNWASHAFCLNFEVLSKSEDWADHEQILLSFFRDVTSVFNDYAVPGEDHQLFVMINDIEEKVMVLDFQGTLSLDGTWKQHIGRISDMYSNQIEGLTWEETECYVKFFPER